MMFNYMTLLDSSVSTFIIETGKTDKSALKDVTKNASSQSDTKSNSPASSFKDFAKIVERHRVPEMF